MDRLLVIDDDNDIRETVCELMQAEGYNCACARNGAEGLARLDEPGIGLVLLDLMMPIMNGWEFLAAYAERPAPRPPVVVITASLAPGAGRAEILRGCRVLAKPIEIAALLAAVAEHLEPARVRVPCGCGGH